MTGEIDHRERAVSIQQLEEFHRFAVDLVRGSDPPPSIEECLRRWREAMEFEETVAAVQQGYADVEAGRVQSLDEVDAEIRQKMGFGPPQP